MSSDLFKRSNNMLGAKIKDVQRQGKEDTKHKEPIAKEDLLLLKTGEAMKPNHPLSLVRNVWFHVVLYWCRRGCEGQRNLSINSFKFLVDERGKEYATMSHDEVSKNNQGGFVPKSNTEKLARMYPTESDTDGFKALKLYLSKVNPNCSAFFQYPRRNWDETTSVNDPCWYENRPLGVNTLSTMMKQISKAAGLSEMYTNHCVRATAITVWGDAGLAPHQICHISGHKDPKSLQSYHHRPSRRQLQKHSDALAEALDGNDTDDQQQPQQAANLNQLQFLPPSTQNQVNPGVNSANMTNVAASSQSLIHSEVRGLGGMFNNCSIQSVQIVFNSSSGPSSSNH